jgi:hypothetical protein
MLHPCGSGAALRSLRHNTPRRGALAGMRRAPSLKIKLLRLLVEEVWPEVVRSHFSELGHRAELFSRQFRRLS